MRFLNSLSFWTKLWTALFIGVVTFIVVMDITAVVKGKQDHMGDQFTLTHWLVTRLGVSIIGAAIGYLIAHFLIVHGNGR